MYVKYLNGQVHRQNTDKWSLGLEGRGELLLHENRVSLWSNESILEIYIFSNISIYINQQWWLYNMAVVLSGTELYTESDAFYVMNVLPPLFRVSWKQSCPPLCHAHLCAP